MEDRVHVQGNLLTETVRESEPVNSGIYDSLNFKMTRQNSTHLALSNIMCFEGVR